MPPLTRREFIVRVPLAAVGALALAGTAEHHRADVGVNRPVSGELK
ncbi:MAG TPA: twin-arginine translocation signal domain-containing protein [bacterium]|nr:twin-arginine translocation signal domain-containing protein [bacterium]